MIDHIFQEMSWWRKHSLKTRVTLFTLVIFLIGIWSLVLYADRTLRQDIQVMLGKQQYLTASMLAAEVNREIETALHTLSVVAANIDPEIIDDRPALQKMLESLPVFQDRFSAGAFITDSRGVAIASVPSSVNRVDLSYGDRDYIQEVLKSARPVVGRPVIGKRLNVPVLGLGVPILDANKAVIGVMAGIVNLSDSNALMALHKTYLGKNERFLIVDAKNRLIIAASEPNRIMEQLPPEGVNPPLDRFINGFEGTEIFVSPVGDEVLASVKTVPIASWYAAVVMPAQVAFEPIRTLEQNLLLAAVLLSLIAGGLTWWVLSRQLAPLQRVVANLSKYAEGDQSSLTLNYDRNDEIGQLIQSFNKLLGVLEHRQKLLQESNELHRVAFKTSPDAVSITRLSDGMYLDVNDGFTQLFGWSHDEVVGRTSLQIAIWPNLDDRVTFMNTLLHNGHCENFETTFLSNDGKLIPAIVSGNKLMLNGELCLLAVTHDISLRKAAQVEIQELSYTDSMTGLPNRNFYEDRFKQSLSKNLIHHELSALIYIDLDNFKSLNESFGHEKGDVLLRTVATRIKECLRQTDVAMRIGGDKFLVLLEPLSRYEQSAVVDVQEIAIKLLNVLSQPYHLSGLEYFSTCSMGIALFGDKEERATEALNKAELAMYQAKSAGRNFWRFYDPQMQLLVSSRTTLEANMREALRRGQFLLHYQVQVDEFGRVIGVESLIRWLSPQQGMIPPTEFIPMAEETGLILPLGMWALEAACQQLVEWSVRPERAHLTIAVNVSVSQFSQVDFVPMVMDIIQRTGASPHSLKLELTESVLINQIDSVIEKMKSLRGIGVQFSLDDFGTGFSSLSYLKRMPLDQLKIDQAFIRDILIDQNDEAIARTVIDLGRSLGFSVIAEGVETEAQRNALYAMGCVLYQGYLFGRPLPIDELEHYLSGKK